MDDVDTVDSMDTADSLDMPRCVLVHAAHSIAVSLRYTAGLCVG